MHYYYVLQWCLLYVEWKSYVFCVYCVTYAVYLQKYNVNNKANGAAKYGISTIFCWVAHAVMSSVARNDYFLVFCVDRILAW